VDCSVSQKSIKKITKELNIRGTQVKTVIDLLNSGNTIPFLARYRKEQTGSLDEKQLRVLEEKLDYFSSLEKKKREIKDKIEKQDQLTRKLADKIEQAETLQEVKDIYYPYKPRRQTRADKAMARGLKPLAELIWEQKISFVTIHEEADQFIDSEKKVTSREDALQGAKDILADRIAADSGLKQLSRKYFWEESRVASHVKDAENDKKGIFEQYYDFSQPVKRIPAFRVLAINRGEAEEILSVKIDPPENKIFNRLCQEVIKDNASLRQMIEEIIRDAFKRLQGPALAREVHSELTARAEEHARGVFSENLEALLLQSTLPDKVIMGIDPAYRTGCKIAIIDSEGNVLETGTIYPHQPQAEWEHSINKILELASDYMVDVIAVGNGTASQETEKLLGELNQKKDIDIPEGINNYGMKLKIVKTRK